MRYYMESGSLTTAVGNQGSYEGRLRGCSGFTLKMIAVVTMFIDHFAATIIERQFGMAGSLWITEANYDLWFDIYIALRCVGRMAFPIYCFLLIEGFMHTRSYWKYVRNMGIFVILSEIPFDMAFQRSFFDMSSNSVFVTLLIGLVMVGILDWLDKKLRKEQPTIPQIFVKCVLMAVVILGSMELANLLHTDYSAGGVAAIAVFYLLRNHRMLGFGVAVLILGLMCGTIEWVALFMLIPIYYYNGTRGKSSVGMKYFFYAFYPVHLLLLALGCYYLGLGI